MQKKPLSLSRVWRDLHEAPDPGPHGFGAMFGDHPDAGVMTRMGFSYTAALAKHHCLFLLGRPGAGKSAEVRLIEQGGVSGFSDECVVRFECKEFGPDVRADVTASSEWRNALAQTKPVRLVFDGLDEGFLREANYFDRLKLVLRNLRGFTPGLRLLLTCRPAEWSSSFASELHAMWGGIGNPAVFALESLSRTQQVALIHNRGLPKTVEFFDWIGRNDFQEFAAWPRSLEWLVDEFRNGGAERLTYTELCRRRVRREFGEDRRIADAGQAAKVVAWEHAILLLAGTLVFCGRHGIALDEPQPECLSSDEMFREASTLNLPGKPALTREIVRDAVRKASHLMEEHRGFHRFQNQSDLEFLASTMLGSFGCDQLAELFGCPEPGGGWRGFPQLATTAANLAAQSQEFFDFLIENDPRTLLRADFGGLSNERRSAALDAILAATAAAQATAEHDLHAHISTLKHPEIAAQLRPWLFDSSQPRVVRDLAFDIARECCDGKFWEEFWRMYSKGADEFLEYHLPGVLWRFGKDWPETRLKELAASQKDSVAGSAMEALLDRGWKPRQLAPFMRGKNRGSVSAFEMIMGRLAREVTAEDVPALLGSFPKLRLRFSDDGEFGKLADALIAAAVGALEREDVRRAVTSFLIWQCKDFYWSFGSSTEALKKLGLESPERRRALLLALADEWPVATKPHLFTMNFPIQSEDYEWLLDETAKAAGHRAMLLAFFTSRLVWRLDEHLREPFERAFAASAELRAELPPADEGGIFETLRRLREESDEKFRLRVRERKVKPQEYSHEKHLKNAIDACREGKIGAWTDVCIALSQPPPEGHASEFFKCHGITSLKGWTEASEELRAEFGTFARSFLIGIKIKQPTPNQTPYDYFSIVYALDIHAPRLRDDPKLRAAIKPMWAQAVFRCCGSHGEKFSFLLASLTNAAPKMMRGVWADEFRERWEGNQRIYAGLKPEAWNAVVEAALAGVLESAPLQPESYTSGLRYLSDQSPDGARRLAAERLDEHAALPESHARRVSIAACIFTVPELWEKAWPLLTADDAEARRLFLENAQWLSWSESASVISRMSVPLLAALYCLLLRIFPLRDAPHHEGSYAPSALDHVYQLQGTLQSVLESHGAVAELQAIFRSTDELRGAWWSGRSVERAKINAHSQRRSVPDVSQFIRLLTTEGGTFVCDNDSLQRAVLASLRRYEKSLHPDGINNLCEKQKPRNEEALQIEIAKHLRQEFRKGGIVINMEPKVESRERSDIRVEVGAFAVTIEVKLGHSKDRERSLRKAMQTQLRDTYLRKRNETHGIYVVGWFFCPTFRPRGLRDFKTVASAKKYFMAQAAKLSRDGYKIAAFVMDCCWLGKVTKAKGRLASSST